MLPLNQNGWELVVDIYTVSISNNSACEYTITILMGFHGLKSIVITNCDVFHCFLVAA